MLSHLLLLFFLCPDEQQGVKTDNQQRDGKRQMCPLLVKEKISEEKDNETGTCRITYGFIDLGIHSSKLRCYTLINRNLIVFLWDLGPKDIENAHYDGNDKTDSQIDEGISPGIQFAEDPHQERISDHKAQARTRNCLEHPSLFAVQLHIQYSLFFVLFLHLLLGPI